MLFLKGKTIFIWFVVVLASLIPLGVMIGEDWLNPLRVPGGNAVTLADQLDNLFQIRMTEAFTFAALPSIRGFASSEPTTRAQRATVALNELQSWVAADNSVREAFVLDRKAIVILSTGADWNQDWSAREFVKNALSGKLDVSAVSHDVNEFSQYYAAPILDNLGNVAGALVARVTAQETWDTVNANSGGDKGPYAVLLDENGTRLADGGDATLILSSLAPLTPDRQRRVIVEHTYGAQVTIVRATSLTHAAKAIYAGSLETLNAQDFGAGAIDAQRLTTKPWTVLVLSPVDVPSQTLVRYVLPLLAAVVASGLAAFLLSR